MKLLQLHGSILWSEEGLSEHACVDIIAGGHEP